MKDRHTELRQTVDAGNRAPDAPDEAMRHLKTAREKVAAVRCRVWQTVQRPRFIPGQEGRGKIGPR